jgi:hypothetical protein
MQKMRAKVPHGRPLAADLAARELTKGMDQKSDNRSGRGLAQPGAAQQRETIVSRVRRFSPWSAGMVLGLAIAAPLAPAAAQNLDAGKSGAQIFSEACSTCHRSPRELRNTSASFLREHYTTNSDMASTMAAYLSGAGERGAAAPQSKRNPAAAGGIAAARDAPAADNARDSRRAPQTDSKPDAKDARASPPSGATRPRPGSAQTTAEVKPAAAPPAKPVLEEFEE